MRRAISLLALSLAACSPGTAAPPPAGDAAAPSPIASSSTAASAPTAPAAPEPESPGKSLREATLRSSKAFDTARSVADEVGPRLSGSPGGHAAIAWAVKTLSAAGLENVHAEKVMVPHWERGAERGEIVSPFPHTLAITALGGSVGTPEGGLEADVIEVDSLDAVDKLDPALVKGKIVFYNVKMERTRDGSGYGHAVGVRSGGAVRAAKLGAVGVVIRSIGTDDNRLPHTGAMRYEDNKDTQIPKIPAAALSIPDAEMLDRIVTLSHAKDKPVRLRITLGAKDLPEVEGANVLGEVPGAGAPTEIVLIGAHLDSWDLGQGALDDGAGCGIAIEVGRQIAAFVKKPRRTVRVVLFANEENGLAGARAYAKDHEAEIPRHSVAFEADAGTGRALDVRFLGAEERRPQFLAAAALVKWVGVEVSTEPARGGADTSPLRAAGVPVIDVHQDGSLYFDVHHTANDTVEHLRKDDIDQAAATFAAMVYGAADAPADFGRIPEDKRKEH